MIAAFTHSLLTGPGRGVGSTEEWLSNIRHFSAGGADAVMVTPGYAKACGRQLAQTSLGVVISVDWTDIWRGPENLGHDASRGEHALMTTVEAAIRYGADAVHMYLFLGSGDPAREAREIERVGAVVGECDRLGLPLLLEPLARGRQVSSSEAGSLANVQLVARIGADLGADLLKVQYTGSPDSFAQVVDVCAVPILVMGGDPTDFGQFLGGLEDAISVGAAGTVAGRNLFLASDTEERVRRVRLVVDGPCRGSS